MGNTSPFFRLVFPRLRYLTNSGGVFPVELVLTEIPAWVVLRVYWRRPT